MIKKSLRKKGFTIVELVIVIAVIAILAAILIPTFSSVVNKANAAAIQAELKNANTQYLAEASDDQEYDPELRLVFEYTDEKNGTKFYLYDGSNFNLAAEADDGFKIDDEEIIVDESTYTKTLLEYSTGEKWTQEAITVFTVDGFIVPPAESGGGKPSADVGKYIYKYAKFDNVHIYKVELTSAP